MTLKGKRKRNRNKKISPKFKKPLLIYHDNCPDGHGAKFVFWLKYGDQIDYIAASYIKDKRFHGIDKATLAGRKIWMVDITFDRKDMIEVAKIATDFIALDHHISNKSKMDDLPFCHFDMGHSGAVLAWMHIFPDKSTPTLLKYIEERDTKHPNDYKLPYLEEILAAVDSYDKTCKNWKVLMDRLDDPEEASKVLSEGSIILRYNRTLRNILKKNIYRANICGYDVPVINTPFFRSEILNEIAVGEPFAAGYHFDGKAFRFSLRSYEGGVRVDRIAENFAGGGHKLASGFTINSLDDLKEVGDKDD